LRYEKANEEVNFEIKNYRYMHLHVYKSECPKYQQKRGKVKWDPDCKKFEQMSFELKFDENKI